jgi:hypothetical protein
VHDVDAAVGDETHKAVSEANSAPELIPRPGAIDHAVKAAMKKVYVLGGIFITLSKFAVYRGGIVFANGFDEGDRHIVVVHTEVR